MLPKPISIFHEAFDKFAARPRPTGTLHNKPPAMGTCPICQAALWGVNTPNLDVDEGGDASEQVGPVPAEKQRALRELLTPAEYNKLIGTPDRLRYPVEEWRMRNEPGEPQRKVSVISLRCDHWYHTECIKEWTDRKGARADCPQCRLPITRADREDMGSALPAAAAAAAAEPPGVAEARHLLRDAVAREREQVLQVRQEIREEQRARRAQQRADLELEERRVRDAMREEARAMRAEAEAERRREQNERNTIRWYSRMRENIARETGREVADMVANRRRKMMAQKVQQTARAKLATIQRRNQLYVAQGEPVTDQMRHEEAVAQEAFEAAARQNARVGDVANTPLHWELRALRGRVYMQLSQYLRAKAGQAAGTRPSSGGDTWEEEILFIAARFATLVRQLLEKARVREMPEAQRRGYWMQMFLALEEGQPMQDVILLMDRITREDEDEGAPNPDRDWRRQFNYLIPSFEDVVTRTEREIIQWEQGDSYGDISRGLWVVDPLLPLPDDTETVWPPERLSTAEGYISAAAVYNSGGLTVPLIIWRRNAAGEWNPDGLNPAGTRARERDAMEVAGSAPETGAGPSESPDGEPGATEQINPALEMFLVDEVTAWLSTRYPYWTSASFTRQIEMVIEARAAIGYDFVPPGLQRMIDYPPDGRAVVDSDEDSD